MRDELGFLDAVAQADLVRSGQASPVELVDAAIARIESVNPQLNAVIHERFEQARAEAAAKVPDGPLRGVPMVMKDLDGWAAGDPYYAGTSHLRDVDFRAPHDSYLMTRFREAGLITVGRTNTPELGLQTTVEPATYGPTHNPWNPAHSSGGSSGGSAAAVASGMVAVGHAGDGGGSIRIPASECGLFGLKPTRGRVSVGPEAGESWAGMVCRLAVTRSVRDTAVLLDCLAGLMPGDPSTAPPPTRPYAAEVGADPGRLRVGFTTTSPDATVTTHPDCVAAVQATAALLESLGHDVAPAAPVVWSDEEFLAGVTSDFLHALAVWTAQDLDHYGEACGEPVTGDGVEPGTWALAELGRSVTGLQYVRAAATLHAYGRSLAPFWTDPDGFDLLLTPTVPEPPPTLGQFTSTPEEPLTGMFRTAALVPFVVPFNMSGQPAMSVPLHVSDAGLPIGVQFVAGFAREDLLIRLAAQLEAAAPWAQRTPLVHA